MVQETAYKLSMGEGYNAPGFTRFFPPGGKRDVRLTNGQDAAVGNGNPVSIFPKVFDSIAKAVEGLFDIRTPVPAVEGSLKILPAIVCPQMGEGRREGKPAAAEKGIKEGKEFPFELIPENRNRDEKLI